MTEETTYYSDENAVRISNARLIIRNTTYAMANIASIRAAETKPNRTGPMLFVVVGVVFIWAGLTSNNSGGVAVFGFVLGAVGLAWWMGQKTIYHVRVSSSSGEADALSSPDREYINGVIHGVNEAMVKRG